MVVWLGPRISLDYNLYPSLITINDQAQMLSLNNKGIDFLVLVKLRSALLIVEALLALF